jgi:hypothetical protein
MMNRTQLLDEDQEDGGGGGGGAGGRAGGDGDSQKSNRTGAQNYLTVPDWQLN